MDTCKPTQTPGLPKSLKFDLKIIRARNLKPIFGGNLFIRYYLFVGNRERIQLNSREIPAGTDPYWAESVSLECHCRARENPIEQLQQQSIVFELRWRTKKPVLGRILRSKLLGIAKISWKDMLGSRNGTADRCVGFEMRGRHVIEGEKQPSLDVGMKIKVSSNVVEKVNKREIRLMNHERCGCRDEECNVIDEEVLIAAAAFL